MNDFSNRYQTEHWAFGVSWQRHTLSLKATKTQQDKKINYKCPIRVRDESAKLSLNHFNILLDAKWLPSQFMAIVSIYSTHIRTFINARNFWHLHQMRPRKYNCVPMNGRARKNQLAMHYSLATLIEPKFIEFHPIKLHWATVSRFVFADKSKGLRKTINFP